MIIISLKILLVKILIKDINFLKNINFFKTSLYFFSNILVGTLYTYMYLYMYINTYENMYMHHLRYLQIHILKLSRSKINKI